MAKMMTLILAAAAAFMDLKTERIGNPLILAGWCGGIWLAAAGKAGVIPVLAGAVFPIAAGAPLFYFRMTGAGDIKLLSAVGALIGFPDILTFSAASILCGGALALPMMLTVTGIAPRLRCLADYSGETLRRGRFRPYRNKKDIAGIHFSVPVLMAALLCAGGIV